MRVRTVRQDEPVGQNRLQERRGRLRLHAEPKSHMAVAEACDGDNAARVRFLERAELDAGVKAQLIGLFAVGAALRFVGKRGLHAQRPARDLEPRQPCALRVARNFEDARAKGVGIVWRKGKIIERGEQRLNALQFERRAEKAGEDRALLDHVGNAAFINRAALEYLLERRFVTESERLVALARGQRKVDAPRAQGLRELRHQRSLVRAGKVHLVDEEKGRYAVALEQPPERARVALHAVAAADDEYRVVEHRERALHLGGKVDVAGRIEQRDLRFAGGEHGLLCKDRDAALALERVGIEKGVAVVHAPEFSQRAGGI